MERLWRKFEPILINEEMLQTTVMEHASKDQAGLIATAGRIYFNEILELHLEHRKIPHIDRLQEFTSLARLHFSNNFIEKIKGLDCLVNLTLLDLSFNRIEKIENLESLRKLEVLNLSSNRLSVIENMDTLEKLTNFSIANNRLEQLDNVLYLRKFKNLFSLNLSGNPFSKEDDYNFFIAAYFPNLKFLDYSLLDMETKNEASIKYHYALEEMRREELQLQQAEEAKKRQEAELKLHTDAFVEFLNGSHLFKSMFKDDPEAETIHCVPEVAQLLQTFEHQVVELCTQLFEMGLAEHRRREMEVNSFDSGQTKALADHQQKASKMLAKFDQQHKERIVELQQISDPDQLKVEINHHNDEINQLSKSFMTLELQLVSQDIIKMLDNNISDMVGSFSETVQGIFAQCRDLEDDYCEKVRQIAVATLENVAKDNLEEDLPDDVKMLFTERDTVMDALATSHDNHLLKINDRETQMITRINAWKVSLIKEIQEKELKQNRMRISDFHRYVDYLREKLEELQ